MLFLQMSLIRSVSHGVALFVFCVHLKNLAFHRKLIKHRIFVLFFIISFALNVVSVNWIVLFILMQTFLSISLVSVFLHVNLVSDFQHIILFVWFVNYFCPKDGLSSFFNSALIRDACQCLLKLIDKCIG